MEEEKPFQKAGIVIYGTNAQGKRALVAPWSEGRFGYKHKYPALPKGSIDDGESAVETAVRETSEETGIDIRLMLGEDRYAAFIAGEEIKVPFESPEYEGVHVVHVGTTPVRHDYMARSGAMRPTALYGIEVEGIENLVRHLKNTKNANTENFQVRHSIKEQFKDAKRYPQLEDFLEWLRTGDMPEREWSAGKYCLSLYGELEPGTETLFSQLEKQVMSKPIENLKEWKEFWRTLPKADYKQLQPYVAKIKKNVQDIGVVEGDRSIYKLDDKDTPLRFFQEGADIVTAEDFIAQCYRMMAHNPDYALAFGGRAYVQDKDSQPLSKSALSKAQVTHSQLAAVANFVPPHELLQAVAKRFNPASKDGALNVQYHKGLEALTDLQMLLDHNKQMPDYRISHAKIQLEIDTRLGAHER